MCQNLIKVLCSLTPLVGNNPKVVRLWMLQYIKHLGLVPAMNLDDEGTEKILSYLARFH